MNTPNSSIENSTSYKYDCLDCENFKRKVKEAEHTVSGRDVLIEMLQEEIKKMEVRYKTSIDDYELLRFKYCTVVQDLSNLREIHKKLERSNIKIIKERDNAKNQFEVLQSEVEKWKNQCKQLQKQLIPNEGDVDMKPNFKENESLHQNILKEVMNIEMLMQNQNETVRDVLLKVLNEMKSGKSCKQIEEVLHKPNGLNKKVKNQGKEDSAVIIMDLNNQIDVLNILVDKLKMENESIKKQLTEKKSNLAQCLDVLEDNHSNLNNLSGNIEMIINEKENYLKEVGQLKDIIGENNKLFKQKDSEINELKRKLDFISEQPEAGDLKKENRDLQKALNQCQKELEQLQEDYLKKEKACTIEKCKQLAKTILETKGVEDTVINVKVQNSLGAAADIDKKIIEASNEAEKCEILLQKKITELEAERDMYKLKLIQFEDAAEGKNQNRYKLEEYEAEIGLLNKKVKSLEEELEQAKRDIHEYDEGKKQYCIKVDSLLIKLNNLEKEKLETSTENVKLAEIKQKHENELKKLNDEINKLMKNNQENEQNRNSVVQIEKNLETANQEKDKTIKEKNDLKNQVASLQKEITRMQEQDERQILMLQDKIDKLENGQNEKQKEINKCCCVVKKIKETIADKKYLEEQKSKLEKENQELKQQISALKDEIAGYKNCDCKSADYGAQLINLESTVAKLQNDLKQLEIELCHQECLNEKLQNDMKEMDVERCRKQCTISHLEQCLDKSNKILGECEKEMKEMYYENENLKKETETLRKDLESNVLEKQRSTAEKNDLQEKVRRISRQSQSLEKEKLELAKNLQKKSTNGDELNHLKMINNNLMENIQKKEEELKLVQKQTEALQQTLETARNDHDKIQKAYRDVKKTFSVEIKKYNEEAQKLNKDNMNLDLQPEEKCIPCLEKEKTIKVLEAQIRELAAQITDLKSYVNRVISDNKNLRTAMDNLLATLVAKLRSFTDSTEKVSLKSNELIVEDILNSLIDLEKHLETHTTHANSSTCTEKCNCMSVIKSTYKIDEKDPRTMPACRMKCGKRIRDVSKYASAEISGSQGIINICQVCCGEKEKEQDDQLQSYSGSIGNSQLSQQSKNSESILTEPDGNSN